MIEQALLCLALNIYHESRGDPIEGQLAVGLVTFNRAKRKLSKVCKVVYADSQFSWTKKTPPVTDTKLFRKIKEIAKLSIILHDFTGGATHYHSTNVTPHWRNGLSYVGQWGNHLFYR